MRSTLKRVAVGLTVGAGLLGGFALPAAATADPNKGQDTKFDFVYLGGSDTTYDVETRLVDLYNGSPGCATVNGSGAATGDLDYPIAEPVAGNKATCAGTAGDPKLNFDHDVVSNIFPTGSSAGVVAAQNGQWHIARSSRPLSGGELTTMTQAGIAKDGIAVMTFGTKTAGTFTKQQLENIYSCNGTRSDAQGSGLYSYQDLFGGSDTTLIHPYGMNSSSGTFATFDTFVAPNPSPTAAPGTNCVEAIGNYANPPFPAGTDYAFENDAKPVLADATAKGINHNGVLWWGSFGVLQTYQFKRQGATFWSIDGDNAGPNPAVAPQTGTIGDNTYPITRQLYRGVLDSTMTTTGTNGSNLVLSTTGATADQAGAARGFVEWTCQPNSYFATAPVNPNNNKSYFTEITGAIEAEGFQRVPAVTGERNFGACSVGT